jgi:hypothetical protein
MINGFLENCNPGTIYLDRQIDRHLQAFLLEIFDDPFGFMSRNTVKFVKMLICAFWKGPHALETDWGVCSIGPGRFEERPNVVLPTQVWRAIFLGNRSFVVVVWSRGQSRIVSLGKWHWICQPSELWINSDFLRRIPAQTNLCSSWNAIEWSIGRLVDWSTGPHHIDLDGSRTF